MIGKTMSISLDTTSRAKAYSESLTTNAYLENDIVNSPFLAIISLFQKYNFEFTHQYFG